MGYFLSLDASYTCSVHIAVGKGRDYGIVWLSSVLVFKNGYTDPGANHGNTNVPNMSKLAKNWSPGANDISDITGYIRFHGIAANNEFRSVSSPYVTDTKSTPTTMLSDL